MKTFFVLFAAFAIVLTACGSSDSEPAAVSTPRPTVEQVTTPAPTAAPEPASTPTEEPEPGPVATPTATSVPTEAPESEPTLIPTTPPTPVATSVATPDPTPGPEFDNEGTVYEMPDLTGLTATDAVSVLAQLGLKWTTNLDPAPEQTVVSHTPPAGEFIAEGGTVALTSEWPEIEIAAPEPTPEPTPAPTPVVTPEPTPSQTPVSTPTDARLPTRAGLALCKTYRYRCYDTPPPIAVGPVSSPSVPPKFPTGFRPGASGPGFTVNEHGRVVMSRLLTSGEIERLLLAAGFDAERATTLSIAPEEYGGQPFNIGDAQLLDWAQKCLSAREDAGVPHAGRNAVWDANTDTLEGFVVSCVRRAQVWSGAWNKAVERFGVDPDCIYEHAINFLPESAAFEARNLLDIRNPTGTSRLWVGRYCQIRISHPLGGDTLVLGPYPDVNAWTEELRDKIHTDLRAAWPFTAGSACSTGTGRTQPLDREYYPDLVDIPTFVRDLFEAVQRSQSCWYIDMTVDDLADGVSPESREWWRKRFEREIPWTTDELDAMGIKWEHYTRSPDSIGVGREHVVLRVYTQIWPELPRGVYGYSTLIGSFN